MGSRIDFFFISFRERKGVKDSAGIDSTLKRGLLVPKGARPTPKLPYCTGGNSWLRDSFQGAMEMASPKTGLSQTYHSWDPPSPPHRLGEPGVCGQTPSAYSCKEHRLCPWGRLPIPCGNSYYI